MKNSVIKILMVFVLLSACGLLFLKDSKSDTELPYADEPVTKVAEVTNTAQDQEILAHNEKYIKAYVRKGRNITNDMVDMTKRIASMSTAMGKTKTLVKIRYEDDSLSTFWVDNK